MSPTVIKVGGSLLDWPELPDRIWEFLDSVWSEISASGSGVVLVVGCGPVGEMIRSMARRHRLGDARAHQLALHALDLTASLLSSLLPRSRMVSQSAMLPGVWKQGDLPILSPRRFLEEFDAQGPDPLPASWEVTTDSIAARIAARLGSNRLILLKSAVLGSNIRRGEAASLGLVDPMCPSIAQELSLVEYVCLRRPELGSRVLLN